MNCLQKKVKKLLTLNEMLIIIQLQTQQFVDERRCSMGYSVNRDYSVNERTPFSELCGS